MSSADSAVRLILALGAVCPLILAGGLLLIEVFGCGVPDGVAFSTFGLSLFGLPALIAILKRNLPPSWSDNRRLAAALLFATPLFILELVVALFLLGLGLLGLGFAPA